MPIPCPKDSLGRSYCAEYIREQMTVIAEKAGQRCEVVISTLPPIVNNAYGPLSCRCPHGNVLWIEPTSDQVAQWTADQVP